jgi:hypothetical protein
MAISVPSNAQVRTVTQLPYPSKANSIAWIANIPYISGAGSPQQLDLNLPTNNPYFGLNFNAARTNFEGAGGGIRLFEDPMVELRFFGFFRHYLLEGRKDLFTGVGSNQPAVKPASEIGR